MKTRPLLFALAAMLPLAVVAQDKKVAPAPAAGEAPVSMCIGCHSIPGYQASFPQVYRVPKIGGQSQQYIEAALKEYRQGARSHPSMTGIAKGLNDQQISAVAAYYAARGKLASTMKRTRLLIASAAVFAAVTAQAADVAKGEQLAQAQCAACHGKDFASPVDPSYPKLAGQYPDYLEKALRDYQTGKRKNPIMAGLAKPLSRADIQNVAAYLGDLPGPLNNTKR